MLHRNSGHSQGLLAEEKEKEKQARKEANSKLLEESKKSSSESVEEASSPSKEPSEKEEKSQKDDRKVKEEKEKKKPEKPEKPAKPKIAPVHIWRAVSILVPSVLVLLLSVYLLTPLSTIKNIEVKGNSNTQADDIKQASGIQDSDYTLALLLDKEKYAERIKSNHWIESAKINYQFPTNFTIEVKEFDIVGYYVSGEEHYPILSSGTVESTPVDRLNLPETYLTVTFNDEQQVKELITGLSTISEDIKIVKELREKSGAGVMDAKKALVETDGDIEKAIELLREKGMAKAAKKADRVAAEGLTGVFVNGNVAAVVEVNAETDFVAKNAQFVDLVNATAKVIAEGKPANNEEALALTMPSGETLEAAYVSATATIGEKISFRRFALLEKTDAQHFGAYQHNGGRIGVISVIEGGDEALAKQISMHIAAMKPTVLSYKELDEQFVKDELAQLNHVIDQDNESRAMVGKPALPHLKYGSKAQLSDEVIAQAEADIKAELAAEGKPEKIWDKIIPGKMICSQ